MTFAGTARGIEARVVPREGFELDRAAERRVEGAVGRRRRCAASRCCRSAFVGRVAASSRAARPQLVIGVGGYSSGPVVMLAALRGIPTLLPSRTRSRG